MLQLNKSKRNRGFVSIFAIFLGAIIVAILTAIYILLIKQIEILNTDQSSFQVLYAADSAFECILYKEQQASSTNSVLLPANVSGLGDCGSSGDLQVPSPIVIVNGRAIGTLNYSLSTYDGDMCVIINTDKETRDTSQMLVAPAPDKVTFTAQTQRCNENKPRVIERMIEFFF